MNDAAHSGDLARYELRCVAIDLWRRGTGKPVLFLHPGDGFAPDDAFLDDLATDHDVLAPWHPGFGHSDMPAGWSSVDDLAYFYLDLIADLGLEDVALVGSSFGGWIAAEMAVRDDRRLGRMVLIDPLGIKVGDRTTRDIADFEGTDPEVLERLLWADPGSHPTPDFTQMDERAVTAFVRSREAFAHYGWRPWMHNPVLQRWLHRVAVPTLVLWGEADGIVSPDYGRAYAGLIPGAEFRAIADAGHYPQVEQAEATVRAVRGFIDA